MKATVKGTRDITGQDAILRSKIIDILKKTFEKYGFQPFYTPVIEYAEVLKTKISQEMLGLIYEFKDKGGRDIGLRYDLTLGLARYAASTQLTLPFKRYQIERAWRYESPQAGRYREFWQADIDIVGDASAKADAECLACIAEALKAIGIKQFTIRVNSRNLLDSIAQEIGIKEKVKVYQALDKLDKSSKSEVEKEIQKLVGKDKAKKFLNAISKTKKLTDDLKELQKQAKSYNIKIKVDTTLVRGLAYYTGLVYEIVLPNSKQSIAGGGRYDDLVSKLGGQKTPATGISIGLDRVCEILKTKEKETTVTKILVIPISEGQQNYAIKILQQLRKQGINSELSSKKAGKAIGYANKQGIPFTLFVGKEEQKKKKVKIKDMTSGKETLTNISQAAKTIKK